METPQVAEAWVDDEGGGGARESENLKGPGGVER